MRHKSVATLLFGALLVLLLLAMDGCDGVVSVSIAEGDIELLVGDSHRLTATVLTRGAASSQLQWTSSDGTVASVDQAGLVTALAPGAAAISATSVVDLAKSDIVTATVRERDASGEAHVRIDHIEHQVVNVPFSVRVGLTLDDGSPATLVEDITVTLAVANGTGNLIGDSSATLPAGSSSTTIHGLTYDEPDHDVVLHARGSGPLATQAPASSNPFDVLEPGDLVELCGTITVDTTLSEGSGPYRLCRAGASVSNDALLKIEPGVTVVSEGAGSLSIGTDGALQAVGTLDQPIRFLGEDPTNGAWWGIRVRSDDARNELRYVEIAHGGGGTLRANLSLGIDAAVRISHCVVRDSAEFGIRTEGMGASLAGFEANHFQDNVGAPLRIYPTQIRWMDGGSTFGGNGVEGIEVRPLSGFFDDAEVHVWSKTQVPFLLTGGFGVNADVVIEPGFQLRATVNDGIQFGVGGSVQAIGTAGEPITLLGDDPAPGVWRGIRIQSDDVRNELRYVEIAHGGGGTLRANLSLGIDAAVRISHCVVRDSAEFGIRTEGMAASLAGFEANHFQDNVGAPLRIYPTQIRWMDGGSTFGGNGTEGIEIRPLSGFFDDAEVHVWSKTQVPFLLTGGFGVNADVVIEPGFQLRATVNDGIQFGVGGSVQAIGTAGEPITLLGDDPAPGVWRGIRIQSDDVRNELRYVEIAHGGGGTLRANLSLDINAAVRISRSTIRDSALHNVRMEGAFTNLHITQSTIRDAQGCGIKKDHVDSVLAQWGNSFSGNGLGDICTP